MVGEGSRLHNAMAALINSNMSSAGPRSDGSHSASGTPNGAPPSDPAKDKQAAQDGMKNTTWMYLAGAAVALYLVYGR